MQKQVLNIPFGQGLSDEVDPWQAPDGKMLSISNAVFTKQGMLTKRNGFGSLSTVSGATQLDTFNDGLLAIGNSIQAYEPEANTWTSRGTAQPINLNIVPINKDSYSQTSCDSATAPNGLVCSVFLDTRGVSYNIVNGNTSAVVVPITNVDTVDSASLGSTSASARVFIVQGYFVIIYIATITGTPTMRYFSVPITDPNNESAAATLTSSILSTTAAWDGVAADGALFVAWYSSAASSGTYKYCKLTINNIATQATPSATTKTGTVSTRMSLCYDEYNTAITITMYDSVSQDAYSIIINTSLSDIQGTAIAVITNVEVNVLTSSASAGTTTIYYEALNVYTYTAVQTHYVSSVTLTQAGVVGTPAVFLRSVGLSSKPFEVDGTVYMLVCYGQTYQPSYFLVDDEATILARLSYSNGTGYLTTQIVPNVSVNSGVAAISYLFKDFLTSVNKTNGATVSAAAYTENGVNLAQFTIEDAIAYPVKLAGNLHLTSGEVAAFDGNAIVEHSFHVFPEDITATASNGSGTLTAQQYYYCFCYEWTDANGNLHRSAPSVPIGITLVAPDDTVTLNVANLRLTEKSGVRIVGYRWSTAQQSFYQFTSISSPTLSTTTADSPTAIVDLLPDTSIIGNTLLYTTGGVLENIAAPAMNHATIFKSRMIGIDAEDSNILWYSKQVLPSTPVEFSDLQTIFVAPSIAAQGSTGRCKALAPLDDKLIIFKSNAIYYMTGNGPDATGANNDFSEPTFISSAVGCSLPNSIAQTPIGLMFQSDKGIWLLGRDLSTKYIGQEVENYNGATVTSAITVPGTTQVRFTLDTGTMLMYDYIVGQWGTFTGNAAVSSTLYDGAHTILLSNGLVRQENDDYLDGSTPVVMSFQTAWVKFAGQQGFQRAMQMYLLSNYLSPHKLRIDIAYDYSNSTQQSVLISPDNYAGLYGDESLFGSQNPFGGPSSVEQWRIFFTKQKCQSVSITVSEQFDGTIGGAAGAGLTFSGISFLIGVKGGGPKLPSSRSAS